MINDYSKSEQYLTLDANLNSSLMTLSNDMLNIRINEETVVLSKLIKQKEGIINLLISGDLESAYTELDVQKEYIKAKSGKAMAISYIQLLIYDYSKTIMLDSLFSLEDNTDFSYLDIDDMFEIAKRIIKNLSLKSNIAPISSTDIHINKVKEYIKQSYSNPYISLDSIAKYVNLNSSYLSSEFTKHEGNGIITYLTGIRMNVAKMQLANTSKKIADISFNVGYLSANYFSQLFKRYIGISPSQFRAKLKNEE